jgi:hypothetical protein
MSSDYFPFETEGNSWEFESEEGSELLLLSSGEAIKGDRECFIVERNFSPEYWYRDSGELARYEVEDYDFGGETIIFVNRWTRCLELPLIEKNWWSDTLEVVKNVLGETVERKVVSSGRVEGVETVDVEAGRFHQCYKVRLDRLRETRVNSELLQSDTTLSIEWYAPDIGLVKFQRNGAMYNLVRVTIHK